MSISRFLGGVFCAVVSPFMNESDAVAWGVRREDDEWVGKIASDLSSGSSSHRSKISSHDCEGDGGDGGSNSFWHPLWQRWCRESDPDFHSAEESLRAYNAYRYEVWPRKRLEQEFGIYGTGAQEEFRQKSYRAYLESKNSQSIGCLLGTVALAALAIGVGGYLLFSHIKGKNAVAEPEERVSLKVESVQQPERTLYEKTGISVQSQSLPERTIDEKTGISIQSRKLPDRTLYEKTGIKVSKCRWPQKGGNRYEHEYV